MHVLVIDAFAGISGDMTVGALLALGVPLDALREQLGRLPVRGYRLAAAERTLHGIRGVKFDVAVDAPNAAHRPYRDLRSMIEASALDPAVKERALSMFARLADAEGRVHGVAADDVEFHEVGAVDAVVDIVAVAAGVATLGVERVYVSALPLGSGTVPSQHGTLPVPAPATLELLKGFPVRLGDGAGELVTPTGAAIVATLAHPGETAPPMRVDSVGYGAGTRTLPDRPNLLRLLLGTAASAGTVDELVAIETNLDDLNPELYDFVIGRLFAAGARDVWLTPVQMKKNRPGTLLRALAEPASRDALASIILRETSALGVRYFPVQRLVAAREIVSVDTEFGPLPVKIARAPDGTVNIAPEYDACREAAQTRGVPLKVVYQIALAAARRTVKPER